MEAKSTPVAIEWLDACAENTQQSVDASVVVELEPHWLNCDASMDSETSSSEPEADMSQGRRPANTSTICSSSQIVRQKAHLCPQEKLEILKYFYENGHNRKGTCQMFGITKKQIDRWIVALEESDTESDSELLVNMIDHNQNGNSKWPIELKGHQYLQDIATESEQHMKSCLSDTASNGEKLKIHPPDSTSVSEQSKKRMRHQLDTVSEGEQPMIRMRHQLDTVSEGEQPKIQMQDQSDTASEGEQPKKQTRCHSNIASDGEQPKKQKRCLQITMSDGELQFSRQDAESGNRNSEIEIPSLVQPVIDLPIVLPVKLSRRQYSREQKLEAVKYYYENGRNKYKTAKMFSISTRSLTHWIANEKKIQNSSKGKKRIGCGRRPFWPDVEKRLHEDFRELCRRGLTVNTLWFQTRASQLMLELHPETDFKFSPGWFTGFKSRYRISLRQSSTDHSMKQEL